MTVKAPESEDGSMASVATAKRPRGRPRKLKPPPRDKPAHAARQNDLSEDLNSPGPWGSASGGCYWTRPAKTY